MPAQDHHHQIVVRSLKKAGWTILREQYLVSVASNVVPARRLYIDIQAQSNNAQIILLEVKGLQRSPIHDFMELVGQYLVYRGALDYLGDATPLYVAIPRQAYHNVIEDELSQQVLMRMPSPIPFVIYDPDTEEIIQWIPPLSSKS